MKMSEQDENELLLAGEVPEVSDLDMHMEHVKSHMDILTDPNHRTEEIVQAVLDHCKKHQEALYKVAMTNANVFGVQNLFEVLEDE
jgi:hypothetical protein